MSKSKSDKDSLVFDCRADPGLSIGVTASIRVQWWLAHAHQ